MHWGLILTGAGGVGLIGFALRDAFEAVIVPRRLNGRFRFSRLYFRGFWPVWRGVAGRLRDARRRETTLSQFGPASMLLLFALWGVMLVVGFALLYWSLGWPQPALMGAGASPLELGRMWSDLYLSGALLVTFGADAGVPHTALSRMLAIGEGGLGLAFVAMIISYLPVLYTAFAQREVSIAMLDARAGSPPSASELLRRHGGDTGRLERYLAEWERWAAQLLESHVSYPALAYFRSQHVNQSWLSALTTVLDACALLLATSEEVCIRQAELTFAIARHAVVDLAQGFIRELPRAMPDRLPAAELAALQAQLAAAGWRLRQDAASAAELARLRRMYEPHVWGMARHLRLEPARWLGHPETPDNWQRSPWERPATRWRGGTGERHF